MVQDDVLSFAYIRQLVAEVVPALRGGGPRRNGGLAAAVVLRPLVAALAAGRVPEHRRVPLFCVLVDALSTGVGDNSGDGTFSDVPVNQFTRGTSLHCSTEISLRFAGGSAVAAGYATSWAATQLQLPPLASGGLTAAASASALVYYARVWIQGCYFDAHYHNLPLAELPQLPLLELIVRASLSALGLFHSAIT